VRIIKGLREGGHGSADCKGLSKTLGGKKRSVFTTEDTESTEMGRRKEGDAVESRKLKVESQLKTRRIYRPERFGRTKKRRVLNTESAEATETRRGESQTNGEKRPNGEERSCS